MTSRLAIETKSQLMLLICAYTTKCHGIQILQGKLYSLLKIEVKKVNIWSEKTITSMWYKLDKTCGLTNQVLKIYY